MPALHIFCSTINNNKCFLIQCSLLDDILRREHIAQPDVSELEDFLPESVDLVQLQAAVGELQQALKVGDSSKLNYAWTMKTSPETLAPDEAPITNSSGALFSPPSRILYSELRVGAAEFKPPPAPKAPAVPAAGHTADLAHVSEDDVLANEIGRINLENNGDYSVDLQEHEGEGEGEGGYYYEEQEESSVSTSADWDYNAWKGESEALNLPPGFHTTATHGAIAGYSYTNNSSSSSSLADGQQFQISGYFPPGGARAAAGRPSPEEEGAFFAVLEQQFPQYSSAALQDVFSRCGRSFPETLDMLYRLENEIRGQYAARPAKPVQQKQKKPEANFSADDFPSLGGPAPTSAPAPSLAFTSNYAGKAKAAAHLPAPAAAARPKPGAAQVTSGSSTWGGAPGGAAAPVWESQGVHKFSTGAAVAAEYAAARADARDHARARNACFQQATQAYLAGNKALAKELGAKGRWHNEQMKAAHAVAAAGTFTKRNAAALEITKSSTGGMPTIDLHGLHVTEAIDHLDDVLVRLQNQGVRTVRLVIGVGQHGKVPARLPSAVRNYLGEWKLPYREPYEGLLEVSLR